MTLFFLIGIDDPLDEEPGFSEPFPKYYYRVDDGRPINDLVNHNGSGEYVKLVPSDETNSDTLRFYIQGVMKNNVEPKFQNATNADVVVWCFPKEYPHEKHLFPNSEGRIYIHENRKTGLVVFALHSFLKKELENKISKFNRVGY